MLSYIIVILITALVCLLLFFAKTKKMPNPFNFKNIAKNGIFSEDWMDWLQANFSDKKGNCTVYDYLIPRKKRQERYAKTHKVHFCTILNDILYDTDSADLIMVQQTKFMGSEPCAKHFYATKDRKGFFFITSRMGKKDELSTMPLKELKKILKDNPKLYYEFVPDAKDNDILAHFVDKQEREEERKKSEEKAKFKSDTDEPGKPDVITEPRNEPEEVEEPPKPDPDPVPVANEPHEMDPEDYEDPNTEGQWETDGQENKDSAELPSDAPEENKNGSGKKDDEVKNDSEANSPDKPYDNKETAKGPEKESSETAQTAQTMDDCFVDDLNCGTGSPTDAADTETGGSEPSAKNDSAETRSDPQKETDPHKRRFSDARDRQPSNKSIGGPGRRDNHPGYTSHRERKKTSGSEINPDAGESADNKFKSLNDSADELRNLH